MEQPSMEQPSILERLRAFNRWTKGWAASIAVAVGIWIVLRSYLIEAFRIPSASMENTLLVGDFLFVNKAIYGGELEIPLTGIRCCRARRSRSATGSSCSARSKIRRPT